jgi:hypothetical protein
MQLQKIKILVSIVAFSLLTISVCSAQEKYVLRITASNCQYNKPNRAKTNFSTGFVIKWKGKVLGIVTALHGVCGCKAISAEDKYGKDFTSLSIINADIANDLAILSSKEMKSFFKDGLEFSNISSSSLAGKQVTMISAPHGVKMITDTDYARVRKNPIVDLSTFITQPKIETALTNRGSPDINIEVLNLEATIAKGSSGAPILYEGKVIGIANGGLDEGRTQVCWAIPWGEGNVDIASLSKLGNKYKELENNNPNQLFLSTCGLDIPNRPFKTPSVDSDKKCVIDEKRTVRKMGVPSSYHSCRFLFQISSNERKMFDKAYLIINRRTEYEIIFKESSQSGFYYSNNVNLGCNAENCNYDLEIRFVDSDGYEQTKAHPMSSSYLSFKAVPEIMKYFSFKRLDGDVRTMDGKKIKNK